MIISQIVVLNHHIVLYCITLPLYCLLLRINFIIQPRINLIQFSKYTEYRSVSAATEAVFIKYG